MQKKNAKKCFGHTRAQHLPFRDALSISADGYVQI